MGYIDEKLLFGRDEIFLDTFAADHSLLSALSTGAGAAGVEDQFQFE